MKPRKLSRREFTRAIKNGLGSAVLHIKEYGDKDVQDILMQACAKNYIYDYQVDVKRSWWLYQMLSITGHTNIYAAHIKTILGNPTTVETEKDLEQLIELASYLFEDGYQEFKPRLMALQGYPHNPDSASALAEALTDMCSFSGFIMGAKVLQKTLNNSHPDDFSCHYLFRYACKTLDDESDTKIRDLLKEEANTNELIAQYWQGVQNFIAQKENRQEGHRSPRPGITLEEVLAIIDDKKSEGKLDFRLRRFGRKASEADKMILMKLLEQEPSEGKQTTILQIFWDVPMPYLPEKIMPLVFSSIEIRRLGARNALQNLQHWQVRALALEALQSKKQTNIVTGFYLLEKNYQIEDIPIIKDALPYLGNRDQTHWAVPRLLDIIKENDHAGLDNVLLWIYNHNPCGICRQEALELLIKRGQAPEQLVFEAQWDVDERVNVLARNTIQPQSS